MIENYQNYGRKMFLGLDISSEELMVCLWRNDNSRVKIMLETSRELRKQDSTALWDFIRNKEKALRVANPAAGARYSGTALFAYNQIANIFPHQEFVPRKNIIEEVKSFSRSTSWDPYKITSGLMEEISPKYAEGFNTILLGHSAEAKPSITLAASDMWLIFFHHMHSQIGKPKFSLQ